MPENKVIWQISDKFDSITEKYSPQTMLGEYFSIYKPEIVEIIEYYLFNLNKVNFYKVNEWPVLTKWKYSFILPLKKYCSFFNKNKFHPTKNEYSLLIIIETKSHFNEYISIRDELNRRNLSHKLVFFEPPPNWVKLPSNDVVIISNMYKRLDYFIGLIQLLAINLFFLFSGVLKNFSTKNYKLLFTEIILLNSKTIIDSYITKKTFQRLSNKNLKTVIFFKAEGIKIRSLIKLFNKLNKKTISIQHGFISENIKYNNLDVDKYLVWSKKFSEKLNLSSSNCEHLPVGCAHYDEMFNYRKIAIQKNSNYRLKNLRLIFLPNSGNSQTSNEEVQFALNLCLEYYVNNKNVQLAIKPHPGSNEQRFIKKIEKENNYSSVKLIDKYDKINLDNYDIAITMNSTIGIESAIQQTPLIIILSNKTNLMVEDYINYRIGEFVDSYERLDKAIIKIKSNYKDYQENTKTFLDDFLINQGKATDKIVNYISSTINK